MKKYLFAALVVVATLAVLARPSDATEALPSDTGICQLTRDPVDGGDLMEPEYVLLDVVVVGYFYQGDDDYVNPDGAICNNLPLRGSTFYYRWVGTCGDDVNLFEGLNDPCDADSEARVVTITDVADAWNKDSTCLSSVPEDGILIPKAECEFSPYS